MAIYHLSVKPISRSGGRSATAAAAYRSGELVHDVTSDEVFDYTRKRGVEHSEIVLPTAAAKLDIHWARDRQQLWNAAEKAENRSNSRVAREYEIALPHELNKTQRVELVRGFAAEIAERHGVAVDFSIHAPHRSGDTRNWHAHLMATTRRIEREGLGDKVSIEWSDGNRRKAGMSPAKEEIKEIRGRWAALTNEHLRARGLDIRVDHRSLEAQGIAREPASHLGPAVSGMERRGIETEVGKRIAWEHQVAVQERLERAAELGKLEREKDAVQRSILDLSGDLKAARAERDRGLNIGVPSLANAAPDGKIIEPRQIGIFDGLNLSRERSAAPERAVGQEGQARSLNLNEVRRQGREEGRALRNQLAQPGAPAARGQSEPGMEPPAAAVPPSTTSPKLDLEQIKAQGRAALQGVQQELQAERKRAAALAQEQALKQERERGRGRTLHRVPGDDDDFTHTPGDDEGLGRGRGRGRGR